MSTHPEFEGRQPSDRTILAWRYMDIPKLISLVIKQELYLRRLDLMPDKFEGLYPSQVTKALEAHHVNFAKATRRNLYVNCWHLGTVESDAMWPHLLRQ